ncbi:hypothetical protein VK96_14595 [Bacillus cereus]|uniref:hypothetical protein n=1 Tax=Bacillus cereus TaxID=1396 RepID=UPI00065D57B2|nr:hypothetical protein [Bacillus cereus]KMN69823.1 hypothetical protein VK96_14595 [Bacillus cereus]
MPLIKIYDKDIPTGEVQMRICNEITLESFNVPKNRIKLLFIKNNNLLSNTALIEVSIVKGRNQEIKDMAAKEIMHTHFKYTDKISELVFIELEKENIHTYDAEKRGEQ